MEKFSFKSKVEFAKENERINGVAERLGIILPSTHTALFQSVFAKLEEANGNGVRLHSKVGETVKQLIGSQANLEHKGTGYMCGTILDAWLENNGEINIIFSFAKNLYREEYTLALEKMAQDDLSVSFELMADTNDIEHLEDGTLILKNVDWQGVGILIEAPPAYKNATVYSVASKIKERAESCKELVFASQIIEKCNEILNQKEGENGMTEEQIQLVATLRAELGDFAKDVQDEDLLVEEKVAELRKAKEEAEAKPEEVKAEKEEITAAEKKISVENFVTTVTYNEDGSTNVVSQKEYVYKWIDSEGNEMTETVKENTDVYHMISQQAKEEQEAKITELQAFIAEQDKKISEKDEEINSFKAKEEEKARLEKEQLVATIKEGLKENKYVANFTDEDFLNEEKVEIAKIRQENDDLKAGAKVKVEASLENEDIDAGTPAPVVQKSIGSILRGKLTK